MLIRHVRGMCSCWRSVTGTAQRSDGSDRGCPLGTVIDPPIWHAGGTPSRTWATATGRCATSTRPSCAGRSGTAAGSRSAPRATRSSPPSPARWGRSGPRWTPSGLRCSLQPPMNDRCLDPHTVARFVGQVFVSNVGGSWPYGWNRSAVSCGTHVTCSGRAWPLRTAGGRWAGRPGSLPPSGWTAIPPGRALCPGRCRGTAACPGRRPRGRPTG
jgi:hypothetical protein